MSEIEILQELHFHNLAQTKNARFAVIELGVQLPMAPHVPVFLLKYIVSANH